MMPRTTIDLDGSVLATLRRLAKASGRTIGDVASELLAHALRGSAEPDQKLIWKSKRMQARVDLDDKDALYRVLDGR